MITTADFKNEVIRASAGTGKTFQLSNRFLRLLAAGVDSSSILATTFTRKGAGEILDRIVQRLATAAMSETAAAQLSSELNVPINQSAAQITLSDLMRNIHRLQIGTLDAFFFRIAQTFRLELGLPTEWDIVSEQQISHQHLGAIRKILRQDSVVNLLHLITGGDAGRRVADLIRSTVDDLYDVYLDSGKIAGAWDRLPRIGKFDTKREFEQECELLLALKYPHKGQLNAITKDVALVHGHQWLALAESTIVSRIASGDFTYYKRPFPDECVEIYQEIIAHCRNFLIDSLTRKNTATFQMLDAFGTTLENEKRRCGELRFDDVNRQLVQLIGDPDQSEFSLAGSTSRFSFRLDHQIEHLLLDEFQDTSIDQWNVLKPFALSTVKQDNKKSFFCVGDMKQAIYGWRGGVAEVFDLVHNQMSNLSEPQQLTRSYRSSEPVIDMVNDVFLNLDRYRCGDDVVNRAVHQWGDRFEEHSTTKNFPGYCSVEYSPDSPDADKQNKDKARRNEFMICTIDRIRRLHEQAPDKSIGVLVRANELVAEIIYMLREAGINASEEGGNPLTDSAAVQTILAAFTLADHPGDSVARFHLAGSPLAEGLGMKPETLGNRSENLAIANQVSQRLRDELLISGYGLAVENMARELTQFCTERELWRLQQLVQEAYHYDHQNQNAAIRLRPQKFVDFIREEFKASDASSAQIRVMTIHQSKGLEFDVVVLPIWETRNGWLFGSDRVIVGRPTPVEPIDLVCRMANASLRSLLPPEFQQAYEETRARDVFDNLCVLYVALTRAVHATHVILPFGTKKDYSSSGAILLSTLCPELQERKAGIIYQVGEEDWYKKAADKTAESAAVPDDHFYLPVDAKLQTARLAKPRLDGRGVPRVSPSGLEGGNRFSIGSIFSTLDNASSLRRGTLVHACLEQVSWLDEAMPDQPLLRQAIAKYSVADDEFEQVYDDFQNMLGQPNLSALLNRQNYLQNCCPNLMENGTTIFDAIRVQVHNEREFALYHDQQFMLGTIDRLVLVFEGDRLISADIIDYKTDHVGDDVDRKSSHYAPQLTAYRQAVAKLYGLPINSIGCKLVFVGSDRIVALDSDGAFHEYKLSTHRKRPRKPHRPANKNYQMKFWNE